MSLDDPSNDSRTRWKDIRRAVRLASGRAWAAPTLIILGLAASFAETLGISLVVLFLYLAVGQTGELQRIGGPLGRIFDFFTAHAASGISLGAIIFALIIIRGFIGTVYGLISAWLLGRASERVQNAVHRNYLEFSYEYIRGFEQSHLLELLASQSWSVANVFHCVTRIVINACSLIVFGAFLLAISWKITVLAIIALVLLSSVLRLLSRPVRALGLKSRQLNERLAETILKSLQGMRTIRAYGQESHQQRSFQAASADSRAVTFTLQKFYSLIAPATEIGYLALLCLIIVLSESLGANFAATLSAVALLYRLQPHARELESNLLSLAESEAPLRAVLSMLETQGKPYLEKGRFPLVSVRKGVRFENVGLTYAGARGPALDAVNFTLPAGQTTAIVGPSGSGKTTIVNLLLRLYEPSAGRIFVDDACLNDIVREQWLAQVAVAGQDVDLIEGTVRENIRLANAAASDADLLEAAQVGGVTAFVEGMSEGFDSWIGQQGLNLSGGQRQRVGLARAVLRNPNLLILDEATSALDGGLETLIRARLLERFAGRTVIIITHRLDIVEMVDHVVYLDEGRVIEHGPPTALRQREDGAFSSMLRGQRQNRP